MNDCSNLRDRLEDVALGEPVPPELSRHLAECETCAAELARQRLLAKRIDDAVNAVVRADPPPQLPADVATRLRPARGPVSRDAFRQWSAALAVAAIFAGIVTAGFRAFERPPVAHADLSALSSWRSPTASLLEPLNIAPQPRPTPGATHES